MIAVFSQKRRRVCGDVEARPPVRVFQSPACKFLWISSQSSNQYIPTEFFSFPSSQIVWTFLAQEIDWTLNISVESKKEHSGLDTFGIE